MVAVPLFLFIPSRGRCRVQRSELIVTHALVKRLVYIYFFPRLVVPAAFFRRTDEYLAQSYIVLTSRVIYFLVKVNYFLLSSIQSTAAASIVCCSFIKPYRALFLFVFHYTRRWWRSDVDDVDVDWIGGHSSIDTPQPPWLSSLFTFDLLPTFIFSSCTRRGIYCLNI